MKNFCPRMFLSILLPVLMVTIVLQAQTGQDYPFLPESEFQAMASKSAYQRFIEVEGIPNYSGWAADLYTLEVKPWKSYGDTGVYGAYVNLEGTGGAVDNWLMELRPGAKTKPRRHIYDAHMIALSGEGEFSVWRISDPENKAVVRWRKGSIFAPPVNTWYQITNTGSEPARIASETTFPLLMDIFHNHDFVFNNPFEFTDRYAGEADYFDPENKKDYGPTTDHHSLTIVNLVRNVWNWRLFNAGQGYRDIDRHFVLSRSSMPGHVEQFPTGTYERGHRHNAGSTVILLSGTGFSLLWPQEVGQQPWKNGNTDKIERVDWKSGVIFVPPTQWYHQHFNTGAVPARFIRLGSNPGNEMFPVKAEGLHNEQARVQIMYANEDPYVRKMFEKELAKHGAKIEMPPHEELVRLEEESGGEYIMYEAVGGDN